ncbi:MAG: hypothetical protein IJB70_06305 [Clostridia bacterium]|nr:hypothetical protein [Clostridia bacterium]
MNTEKLRSEAKKCANDFLENEKEYMLGFVEAEQQNPLTKTLGETFRKDTAGGVKMLVGADKKLCSLYANTLNSDVFDKFTKEILNTIKSGGRIILSGCGSSGRLNSRVEASWREAIQNLSKGNNLIADFENSVLSLMAGGDYAIIRALESFEDYISMGKKQVDDFGVNENDLFVGVTATGETTCILGSAKEALDRGAKVWMVVCTNPESVTPKLKRAADVFNNKNTDCIYMPCGAMAVTGSTRMQSSSIEQAVILSALEIVLCRLLSKDISNKKENLIWGFEAMIASLENETTVKKMSDFIEKEQAVYEKDGTVTYFADDYVLDILTDTTERCPTFSTPAFKPSGRPDLPSSWAFVKNPSLSTKEAWKNALRRVPRCIEWTTKDYQNLGLSQKDIDKIPPIDAEALYGFTIGSEPMEDRENGESLAMWIGFEKYIPESFYECAKRYKSQSTFCLKSDNCNVIKTHLCIFEHLSMKLAINTVSTGTMARMGRIYGNFMVYLGISNKKLVDRSIRIISELTGISYEEAANELFYTKLLQESKGKNEAVVKETIDRIKDVTE